MQIKNKRAHVSVIFLNYCYKKPCIMFSSFCEKVKMLLSTVALRKLRNFSKYLENSKNISKTLEYMDNFNLNIL